MTRKPLRTRDAGSLASARHASAEKGAVKLSLETYWFRNVYFLHRSKQGIFLWPRIKVKLLMKDCLIHLGLAKTGTTSIQASLFQNRRYLRQHGIFYPAFTLNGESRWSHACHALQAITLV